MQQDAHGQSPGCYVLTTGGRRHNLIPSNDLTRKLTIRLDPLLVAEQQTTDIVVDFDLRKLIILSENPNQVRYTLAHQRQLEESIRVLPSHLTGTIRGQIENPHRDKGKVVVYAYPSGTFSAVREIRSTAMHETNFLGAQNSAVLRRDGTFVLPFLTKGQYSLFLIEHRELPDWRITGVMEVSSSNGIDLHHVSVEAGNETTIAAQVSSPGRLD